MADTARQFDAWVLLALFYPAQVACIRFKQRSRVPQDQPAIGSGLFDDVHRVKIALTAILCQARIARTAYPVGWLLGHAENVNTNQKLGRAIDQLRTRKGVNKKEMALATGIDAGNLNRIIAGTQWPSPERLDTLAAYFDLKPSDLFRIGEQGFIEAPRREDARRTALKAMIDKLEENQLDAVFRQQVDDDCEHTQTGPTSGKTPPTSRAA